MPVTTTPLGLVGAALTIDTDADGTAENDVRAGAVTLYTIDVDNVAAAASFLKFYDALSPTVGTTAPDMIFRVPASTRYVIHISGGFRFATGLSFACVTTAGTAGTTNPASDVIVRLVTSN